jgi:hypothetical protein
MIIRVMEIEGNIKKMRTVLDHPVHYYLPVGNHEVKMNDLIGSDIQLEYLGEINCIRCGRTIKKSFFQGFCYPCFISAPETEECVLRPELCRAHLGEARDMEFAKGHCLIEHVVYLSYTSGVKVGVTRNTQVPYRWIDQGAVRAIELARTPNRYIAGTIEVFLKKFVRDKTDWRGMLKNGFQSEYDLSERKIAAVELLSEQMKTYVSKDNSITEIEYPVTSYPSKVVSLNFDKAPVCAGKLVGIKGQYLVLDDNRVINIRKFGGYKVRLTC